MLVSTLFSQHWKHLIKNFNILKGAGGPELRMNPNQEKEKSPLELYVNYG